MFYLLDFIYTIVFSLHGVAVLERVCEKKNSFLADLVTILSLAGDPPIQKKQKVKYPVELMPVGDGLNSKDDLHPLIQRVYPLLKRLSEKQICKQRVLESILEHFASTSGRSNSLSRAMKQLLIEILHSESDITEFINHGEFLILLFNE